MKRFARLVRRLMRAIDARGEQAAEGLPIDPSLMPVDLARCPPQ